MDGLSLNLTEERITQLKSLFPDVVSEGKVDFDRLKAALGEHLTNPRDRYELSWAGKAEARKEVQKQTSATLLPDRESSVDFDTSENIFIEGENLEALRILQKSYFGKVKMIYIDPPYNTGNDSFVYPDDYSERKEEYERRTGIKDEAGYLNKQDLWKKNTKESGQFHSVWLSMMYPRLYMARNLLREDGVIFVSIDDHEQGNLKLLMDEVFGEENFVASLSVKLNPRGRNLDKYVAKTHEFIIIYVKNASIENAILGLEKSGKMVDEYDRNDDDGPYRLIGLRNRNQAFNPQTRPKLYYPLYVDSENGKVSLDEDKKHNIEVYPITNEGVKTCWTWGVKKVKDENNLLIAEESAVGWRISRKDYLYDEEGNSATTLVKSIWDDKEINNDYGKKAIKELFGKNVMSFPKSPYLCEKIISIGTDTEAIILDFFAGSATTAQAVLEMNAEDGGNRKFILVQLPEAIEEGSEAYKAGYRTIADISNARIQKVIAKIKEQQATQLDFKDKQQDLGFKSYRVAPSNFKVWQQDVQGAGAIATQLEVFQNPYREGTNEENMLYELMLKSGLPLTAIVEEKEAEGVKYYVVNGDRVFALHGVSPALIQAVEALKPLVFITLDKHFANQDQLMSNTQLQLREAGVEFRVI